MDWKRPTIFSIIPPFVLVTAFLCLPACSRSSPEEQIRSLVQRAQTAAKERDLGAFKALGDWEVRSAAWERTEVGDFLGGMIEQAR